MTGWAVVFAAVTAVDVHALATGRRTLSTTFRETYWTHPLVMTAATAYTVAHLIGALPRTVDPLARLGGNR